MWANVNDRYSANCPLCRGTLIQFFGTRNTATLDGIFSRWYHSNHSVGPGIGLKYTACIGGCGGVS